MAEMGGSKYCAFYFAGIFYQIALKWLFHQITLSGLVMVLINFATLIYYDPDYLSEKGGATDPPRWIYFTYVQSLPSFRSDREISYMSSSWAAGLFIYQSFDAIDG